MTDQSGEPVDDRVALIAWTEFVPPASVPFVSDADGGQALVEFAGRACYRSWDRPRPATATNAGYLRHLLEVGHLSLWEHGSATFYLTAISRNAAREILRHRHFSCTELSPRQLHAVHLTALPDSWPDSAIELYRASARAAVTARDELLQAVTDATDGNPLPAKQARNLANSLLPGAVATDLVVSGNYRSWRHFIAMRGTDAADPELRGIAVSVLRSLLQLAPHAFDDFRISTTPDGGLLAASPYVHDQ